MGWSVPVVPRTESRCPCVRMDAEISAAEAYGEHHYRPPLVHQRLSRSNDSIISPHGRPIKGTKGLTVYCTLCTVQLTCLGKSLTGSGELFFWGSAMHES